MLPVTVADQKSRYQGTRCEIDPQGRAIVNGKRFMPLGFFIYNIPQKHIDILAKSPFNTLMSYPSTRLALDGKATPNRFNGIIAVMDELDRHGIKLIFSVKDIYDFPKTYGMEAITEWNGIKGPKDIVKAIIARLKPHPALLAWYICDELSLDKSDAVTARRHLLNTLDPDHPTYSVYCLPRTFRYYSAWTDVFGCDPYPIGKKSDRDMKDVTQFMESTRQTFATREGMACWVVPQAFNWGFYKGSINDQARLDKEFRYPSELEMLAFAVEAARLGAKGFLYFNFSDFFRGPDKDQFKKRWPGMLRVGWALKDLEPFILSDHAPKTIKPETSTGRIHIQLRFDDKGNQRVLITAIGPDKAVAEFIIPGIKFESTRGKTKYLGNNRYKFSGENICCDILIPKK